MREVLEYHRDRVAAGELWRLVTGQLVHWSPGMLVADVTVLLVAGFLLARRSRRLLVFCLPLSAAAVGGAVHFLAPHLVRYRGSSGIASALVVACILDLAQTPGASRRAAIAASIFLAAKLAYELTTGLSISSATLPPGVGVAPVAHVAGGASGAVAWLATTSHWRREHARMSGACGGLLRSLWVFSQAWPRPPILRDSRPPNP